MIEEYRERGRQLYALSEGRDSEQLKRVYEAMGYPEWVAYTLVAVLEAVEEGM